MALLWATAALADPEPSLTGTQFADLVDELHVTDRQREMVEALFTGHGAPFSDRLVPISWIGEDTNGVFHKVEVDVMCDYLALGTNEDFLRLPLNLYSALEMARDRNMVLPTTLIVDAVYVQATERLAPQSMPPDDAMRTVGAYLRHRDKLEAQGATSPTEGLRAGHKKDVVLTPRLEAEPAQLAIYGWHRDVGDPIQGLNLWHGARYTDYSHGVRLVARTIHIDGVEHDFYDVWASDLLWPLIAAEGPWPGALAFVTTGPTPRD